MKDGIERIHELLEELAEVSKALFPDYTKISVDCGSDGYRTFTITKWESGAKAPETAKRRELFEQTKLRAGCDWDNDRSARQNEYYERIGLLLKK